MDTKMEEISYIQVISNVLSALTIFSCLFLKVPQIISMRNKRSSEGIYLQAMLMEVTGYTIITLYNFTNGYSFMTYLEYPIILVQIYIMCYYALRYLRLFRDPMVKAALVAYFMTVLGFAADLIPQDILSYLVPLCTPLSGFAKVSYIYGIMNTGNADAVSLTTWIISVTTNMARIFTVYVDSADFKLMANFFISSVLSIGVLMTAISYQQENRSLVHLRKRKPEYRRHSHLD